MMVLYGRVFRLRLLFGGDVVKKGFVVAVRRYRDINERMVLDSEMLGVISIGSEVWK